jgi:hypothetical protein
MLSEALVSFCQFLRGRGLTPGLQQTIDSLEAAKAVNLADRESLKYALKAILCSSKEDWDRFDGLFEEFWTGKSSGASSPANEPKKRQEKAKAKDARANFSQFLESAKGAAARRQTAKELAGPSGGALDTVPVLREFFERFRSCNPYFCIFGALPIAVTSRQSFFSLTFQSTYLVFPLHPVLASSQLLLISEWAHQDRLPG